MVNDDGAFVKDEADGAVWEDLDDANNPLYPAESCSVDISVDGIDAWVRVVAPDGSLWETHGVVVVDDITWNEPWVAVPPAGGPPLAFGASEFSGALGALNSLPRSMKRS
ncbi:hypothetical protein [Streptomyces sp. NPDC002187]|uniref:hypothetical protein n=1 Tax=Streptomyces sp. NPDC002187 TaxID=3364637 RepID=UPI00369628B6